MRKKFVNKNVNQFSSGIDISLEELIALRSKVVHNPIHVKKRVSGLFYGQHIAKTRGRGIEFDTTREYQPGDDIRRMAWRVTARSLKPHIKVYHEERERPVWLGVDLSPSLYFGTRCMFKSIASIKQAAFLGWSYLQKCERIGAVIASPGKTLVYRPQAREREFLLILKSLSQCSNTPPAFTQHNCLHQLLVTLEQQVRTGHLVYILSDFLEFDNRNKKLMLYIAQRAQIKLIFVYDPFEADPPPAYQYLLTDGQKIALFDMDKAQNRNQYQQQFQDKLNDLIDFSRKHSINLQILRTNQEEVLAEPWMRSYSN